MNSNLVEPTATFGADSPQDRASMRRELSDIRVKLEQQAAVLTRLSAFIPAPPEPPKTALEKLRASLRGVFTSKFGGRQKPNESKLAKPVDPQLLAATGSEGLARFASGIKLPPKSSK